MADYDVPTADDVFERFPSLDSTKDDMMTAIIAEAVSQVSTKWRAADYPVAIMYLAAHLFVTETGETTDRSGVISSESFGQQSISYSSNSNGPSARSTTNLDTTEYGRRFADLRRRNFPGVLVAGC